MAEQSDTGAVRSKFPKFTKKPRPRPRTPEATAEVRCRSEAATSPLTPLPEPRVTNPNAHTAKTPRPGPVVSVLKRTHLGQPPDVCGPWDGKVASHGPLSGFVITSPTQHFVPQLPKDADIINTYVDGRWGVHEYSRHPQWYLEDMTHIACIPRNPSPTTAPDVLFLTLQGNDHWHEDLSVAVNGLGCISPDIRSQLQTAANTVIDSTAALEIKDERITRYHGFLVMLLRQVLSRMNYLPAVASRAIAIAAHVQRLCLELAGLKTYVQVVLPHIESSQDFSRSVLDVVGGFLREGAVTQTWHRVGVPYWVLQPVTANRLCHQTNKEVAH